MELHNVRYITPVVRLSACYPLTSSFNHVPQKPNTPLHIGADLIAGIKFDIINFKYFQFNAGPALHMLFLSADRWNYFNLGGAAVAGIEFSVNQNLTLLLDGYLSLDNGNLGSNRLMESFDIAYQYQAGIGVRYSRIKLNDTALFPLKPN